MRFTCNVHSCDACNEPLNIKYLTFGLSRVLKVLVNDIRTMGHYPSFCQHVLGYNLTQFQEQQDRAKAEVYICLQSLFAAITEADDMSWRQSHDFAGPQNREDLRGGEFDCIDIPDAAMTLAVVASMANGPTTIKGVESWRVKETERMAAIVAELTKLGCEVSQYFPVAVPVFQNPSRFVYRPF